MPESYEFRRSLRASQKRRAAALRKRRTVRSYRSTVGVLISFAIMASLAAAAGSGTRSTPQGDPVRAAQAALGVTADGIVGPVTRRAVRNFQRTHGLVVDGIIGHQTLAALGLKGVAAPGTAVTATKASTSSSPLLAAIAQCESGGDPTAISGGGRYRGKYQFTRSTWRSVGGTGDPAKAPEAEQDRRAEILMKTAGPSQWPACSAKAGV